MTGVWEGSFHILSTSRIKGGEEFGGQEVVGSIRIEVQQQGAEVIGWLRFSDVQERIMFNYAPLDYMTMIVPDYDRFAGTVNPDGSLKFTEFWR